MTGQKQAPYINCRIYCIQSIRSRSEVDGPQSGHLIWPNKKSAKSRVSSVRRSSLKTCKSSSRVKFLTHSQPHRPDIDTRHLCIRETLAVPRLPWYPAFTRSIRLGTTTWAALPVQQGSILLTCKDYNSEGTTPNISKAVRGEHIVSCQINIHTLLPSLAVLPPFHDSTWHRHHWRRLHIANSFTPLPAVRR
jgi:hypothetical protein